MLQLNLNEYTYNRGYGVLTIKYEDSTETIGEPHLLSNDGKKYAVGMAGELWGNIPVSKVTNPRLKLELKSPEGNGYVYRKTWSIKSDK